jgi:putative PIN family toxin of toxin-antitoxin system
VIRVVIDTNVLVSGFIGRERVTSTPGALLRRWQAGAFLLIVSHHILTELERTLDEAYFRRRVTSERRLQLLALLRQEASITPLTVTVQGVASHPEDDLVLSAAVSAGADYLVTGDGQLQRLGRHGGVTIVSPRVFLDRLSTTPESPE